MNPDKCPKNDEGHIFSPHAKGCGTMKAGHYHCLACDLIRIHDDLKKEWK